MCASRRRLIVAATLIRPSPSGNLAAFIAEKFSFSIKPVSLRFGTQRAWTVVLPPTGPGGLALSD